MFDIDVGSSLGRTKTDGLFNKCLGYVFGINQIVPGHALDIILVSFILYNAIKLVRETRAEQLIKGLLILCVVWAAAFYLQLYMVSNILSYIFQFGVIAIIVLFQPEIRRALEQLGRKGIGTKYWSLGNFSKNSEETELAFRQRLTRWWSCSG